MESRITRDKYGMVTEFTNFISIENGPIKTIKPVRNAVIIDLEKGREGHIVSIECKDEDQYERLQALAKDVISLTKG